MLGVGFMLIIFRLYDYNLCLRWRVLLSLPVSRCCILKIYDCFPSDFIALTPEVHNVMCECDVFKRLAYLYKLELFAADYLHRRVSLSWFSFHLRDSFQVLGSCLNRFKCCAKFCLWKPIFSLKRRFSPGCQHCWLSKQVQKIFSPEFGQKVLSLDLMSFFILPLVLLGFHGQW